MQDNGRTITMIFTDHFEHLLYIRPPAWTPNLHTISSSQQLFMCFYYDLHFTDEETGLCQRLASSHRGPTSPFGAQVFAVERILGTSCLLFSFNVIFPGHSSPLRSHPAFWTRKFMGMHTQIGLDDHPDPLA